MRRFFALMLLLVAAASVSCSQDKTTDTLPDVALSGATKTVTLNTSIADTRTALDENHKLQWVEGDTFGILCVAANGTQILGHIESPAYRPELEEYKITVPAETGLLCCYYPYNADYDDWLAEQGAEARASAVPFTLKTDYEFSEPGFEGNYHYMAAKSELSADGFADVVFTPLVSLLEFNIYDTAGDGSGELWFLMVNTGDEFCAGRGTLDFTASELSLSSLDSSELSPYLPESGLYIPASKEEGLKVFIPVAKGTYENLTVKIGTDIHAIWSDPYTFTFSDVELTALGRTVNLNLSKAPHDLVSLPYDIVTYGAWLVYTYIEKASDCAKYVVAVMPSNNSINSEGDEMADGYDEERFRSDAAMSLMTYQSKFGSLTYMVYDQSTELDQQWMVYDGMVGNDGEWSEPSGLRMAPNTDYTLAVYAVAEGSDDEEGVVYTWTFTSDDYAVSSNAAPRVSKTDNTKERGAATISADNAAYIFYGQSTAVPTNELVKSMFENREADFARYDGSVDYEFTKMNQSEPVYIWAVAVSAGGEISTVGYEEFAPQTASYDSDAKVESFNAQYYMKPRYEYEQGTFAAEIELSAEVEKFAIVYYADTYWNTTDDDTKQPKGESVTLEALQRALTGNLERPAAGTADLVFTKNDIEDGVLKFGFVSPVLEETGLESYHMFAMAMDSRGHFGQIVNLANPMMDPSKIPGRMFFDLTVDFTDDMIKEYESGNKGDFVPGEADPILGYWTQSLENTVKPSDWLDFVNLECDEDYFATNLSWKATANKDDVASFVYILYVGTLNSEKDLVQAAKNLVDEVKDVYVPGEKLGYVGGFTMPVDCADASSAPVVSPLISYCKYYLENNAYGEPQGRIFYTILADKQGYLTLSSIGYIEDGKTSPTIVPASDILNVVDYLK